MVVHNITDSPDFYRVTQLCKNTVKYLMHTVAEDKRYIKGSFWYAHSSVLPGLIKRAKESGVHTNIDYSTLPIELKIKLDYILQNKKKISSIKGNNDYSTLFLTEQAPDFIVDAVWRALLKRHHPDVGGDSSVFLRYKEAYDRIKR